MKKQPKILYLLLLSIFLFTACSGNVDGEEPDKVEETSPTQEPTTEPTNDADVTQDAEQESSDDTEGGDTAAKKKYEEVVLDIETIKIKNKSLLLSSKNAKEVTSATITKEEQPILNMQEIDKALQAELDSGNYTFEEPLIVLDPYQNSPLTAVALFQTKEEVQVRVTVPGSTKLDDVTGVVKANTSHRVPIIGLYAGKENKVLLELLDKKGNVLEKREVSVKTDVLPESMEDVVNREVSNGESAYNLTYVSGQATPHAFAYDRSGAVRWYITMATAGYGIMPLSENRFAFQPKELLTPTREKPHTVEIYEMDYLGRIHMIYYVENGYHHEVTEKTPGGNLLVLSNSIKDHVEDRVIEIDRETGDVVKQLDMTEIFGTTYVDMIDWAHLNSAQYIPEDNTLVLSPRNIHSGIKIDWETNELKWILSDPRFWEDTPFYDKVLKGSEDIIWHYQQHTVYQLEEDIDNNPDTDHIMLFDNHWHKTRKVDFFDKKKDSYVSLYTINEKKMTVEQIHVYKGVKSKITSNFGFDYENKRVFSMGGVLDPVVDGRKAMIYEFDYDTEKVVNQYSLRYTFYRAYEMNLDYNDLAAPLTIPANYQRGRLMAPAKTKEVVPLPKQVVSSDVKFLIRGDMLYIEAKDHSIAQVEFLSEGQSYIYDMTYVPGTTEYSKVSYKTGIPLQGMKDGTYQIAIAYIDAWYNSGHEIKIVKKE